MVKIYLRIRRYTVFCAKYIQTTRRQCQIIDNIFHHG